MESEAQSDFTQDDTAILAYVTIFLLESQDKSISNIFVPNLTLNFPFCDLLQVIPNSWVIHVFWNKSK